MNRIIIVLLATAVICFSSCSKSNKIPATSGSINGIPATTLYGTSGNTTDYILYVSGTNAADKNISYNSQTYAYTNINAAGDIFIVISPATRIMANVTTSGSKTVLKIDNASTGIFLSTQYTSR